MTNNEVLSCWLLPEYVSSGRNFSRVDSAFGTLAARNSTANSRVKAWQAKRAPQQCIHRADTYTSRTGSVRRSLGHHYVANRADGITNMMPTISPGTFANPDRSILPALTTAPSPVRLVELPVLVRRRIYGEVRMLVRGTDPRDTHPLFTLIEIRLLTDHIPFSQCMVEDEQRLMAKRWTSITLQPIQYQRVRQSRIDSWSPQALIASVKRVASWESLGFRAINSPR